MESLKKINAEIANVLDRLQDAVDMETGEITDPSLLEELESLQMKRDEKIPNIIRWVISKRAELKAIKEEKERLDKRFKAGNREIDFIVSHYLPSQLKDGETFHCADGDIKYRHSKAVKIINADSLPMTYCRQVLEVNKAEILKALKAGTEIPGAELEERVKLVVV